MTQAQLAQRIGCAEITIRKIEADERKPSSPVAVLLAQQLGFASEQHALFVQVARRILPVNALPAPIAPFHPLISAAGLSENTISCTNLPVRADRLIGRSNEIADIQQLFRSHARLVTLTGTGGTGKTSLAFHIAASLLDSYSDGVWFIDLSSISDHTQIALAIAQVLGLPTFFEKSIDNELLRWVRERHLLLLLDNCEHLVVGVARLVANLLKHAPYVRILATSRIPLRISTEQEYSITPLAVPDPELELLPEQLSAFPAITLFMARAQAIRPEFTITPMNAHIIAEICICLEGLPLAIELAAARIRLFSPEHLLKQLNITRIQTLIGGARDVPLRQQTMAAAIDWSYKLLSIDQQTLLHRLGSFKGSWTLDQAEATCGHELNLLVTLEGLIEHNLVQRIDVEGEVRYRMLETIREYALHRN